MFVPNLGVFDTVLLAFGKRATLESFSLKSEYPTSCGRCGGLMVSALDSGLNDPGSSRGQGPALCS